MQLNLLDIIRTQKYITLIIQEKTQVLHNGTSITANQKIHPTLSAPQAVQQN